jgi:hypothetical protein
LTLISARNSSRISRAFSPLKKIPIDEVNIMNKKRRNILLICVAIFLISYIARSIVTTQMRIAYARQQALRRQARPKAASAMTENPAAPTDPPLANLSGVWEGRGRVPGGRGLCDLRLELKQSDPAHYSGYSRFSCMSVEALTNPKDVNVMANMVDHLNPDAAILTGAAEKGAIHFRADKTIGTDINGCTVTELTITPFGTSAVAAEWKEGTCQGGNLMMQRAVR